MKASIIDKYPLKFSVIIPIYNVEDYLVQCVESVLNQSYPNIEIVLVDDGSSDDSAKICDELASRDRRIVLIHQINQGQSKARNTGILHSHGDYYLFLDSDDFWIDTNFLQKLASYLETNPVDVVSYNFKKYIEGQFSKAYFKSSVGIADEEYVRKHEIWISCVWNKAIKSALFKENDLLFVSSASAEDVEWCARLLKYAHSWSFLNENVVAYRFRNGSVSNSVNYEKIDCLLNYIVEIGESIDGMEIEYEKKTMLHSYLAYQIGTLLLNVIRIEDPEMKQQYIQKIKPWMHFLTKTKKLKLKLLYCFFTVFFLK